MNFDDDMRRLGTNSVKWDQMEALYGIPSDQGLAMWIADMDFRPAEVIQRKVKELHDNANYGYFSGLDDYRTAVGWWMENRHGWNIQSDWIRITAGLGNAIAMCLQTFSEPGDGVIVFSPVYHEFAKKIRNNNRQIVEFPLEIVDGVFQMNFDAYEAQLTGNEKIMLLCSPHNPAGRIWTTAELRQIADFCETHDLLLISDEIHQDLVFPGQTFQTIALAAPEISKRMIVLTSASKTFNIAGTRTGHATIPDDKLRASFDKTLAALDLSPNLFGVGLTTAAYSPEGAEWVDQVVKYVDGNHQHLLSSLNGSPGIKVMPMQSTYLAWVDFSGTGMEFSEINERVTNSAKIAASPGPAFGKGGEACLRFNIATTRANITEAVNRILAAFSDIQ